MALPTQDELLSLDFLFLGEPYLGNARPAATSYTMDYLFLGSPFVINEISGAPPTATPRRARIMTYIWGN